MVSSFEQMEQAVVGETSGRRSSHRSQGLNVNEFSEDIARYKAKGNHGKELWLNPLIWVIATHRLRNWVTVSKPIWPIRVPLVLVCFCANKFFQIFMGMDISPGASIGAGFYLGHVGGVIISQFAVLGKNCDVSHRVTIGVSAMGRQGAPIIGDDVYIGTGATLVGLITIGNGAKIAANTLVIDDVPEGATAIGVPGRIFLAPKSTTESKPTGSR
jgi:serine O-acetyltransferase